MYTKGKMFVWLAFQLDVLLKIKPEAETRTCWNG